MLEDDKVRLQACVEWMPRVMCGNINPGFVASKGKPRLSETTSSFRAYTAERPEKTHNRHKDDITSYVDKALALHDGELRLMRSQLLPPHVPLAEWEPNLVLELM